eukprot:UN24928
MDGYTWDLTPLRGLSPLTSEDGLASLGVCGNYAKECDNVESSLALFDDKNQTQCSRILSKWTEPNVSIYWGGNVPPVALQMQFESGEICQTQSNVRYSLDLYVICWKESLLRLELDQPPCAFTANLWSPYGCPQ